MVEEYDKDIEWVVKYNGTTTHKFENIGRLVRCKDCKWYRYHNKQCVKGGHHGTKSDDFCNYGERKQEE